MNIIYVHTHDSGRFMDPYGYDTGTPNIMRMADMSLTFDNCYCGNPTCSPSRACLLTSQPAHVIGMYGLAHRHFRFNDYSKHLANFLKNNDYHTCLCGVQHESENAKELGYIELHEENHQATRFDRDRQTCADAITFLDKVHKQDFFLSIGFSNTHRIYEELDVGDKIDIDNIKPFDGIENNRDNREDIAKHIKGLRLVDELFGKILDKIKEKNLLENTVIFFTTDHGMAFPRMKCTLYDTGIGVSFMLYYPNIEKGGQRTDGLVSQLDIFPTLCDIVGLEKPKYLYGKSLMPLIDNGEEVNDSIFAELNYHAQYEPMRAIRDKKYKFIMRFGDNMRYRYYNIDDSPEKDRLISLGALEALHENEELYDLAQDPNEKINLAMKPEYSKIATLYKNKLIKYLIETKDNIWSKGIIEAPIDAVVNDINAR